MSQFYSVYMSAESRPCMVKFYILQSVDVSELQWTIDYEGTSGLLTGKGYWCVNVVLTFLAAFKNRATSLYIKLYWLLFTLRTQGL